jgi:hypothetical protein
MCRLDKRGISMIEYVLLIVVVMGILFAMWPQITRAMAGRWKSSGDAMGFGRRFDSQRSTECTFAQVTPAYGVWYDNNCYQQAVSLCPPGAWSCETAAKESCKTQGCCENNKEPAGGSNCG